MKLVYIGIGSNIEPQANIARGMALLRQRFVGVHYSTLFESEAVGFDGDNFINLVAAFHTILTLGGLDTALNEIEDQCGRSRIGPKFSPRTLDLDILLYNELICIEPIKLPRAELLENAYVLRPLSELAPQGIHPQTGKTFLQHWQDFPQASQKLWPITLDALV